MASEYKGLRSSTLRVLDNYAAYLALFFVNCNANALIAPPQVDIDLATFWLFSAIPDSSFNVAPGVLHEPKFCTN